MGHVAGALGTEMTGIFDQAEAYLCQDRGSIQASRHGASDASAQVRPSAQIERLGIARGRLQPTRGRLLVDAVPCMVVRRHEATIRATCNPFEPGGTASPHRQVRPGSIPEHCAADRAHKKSQHRLHVPCYSGNSIKKRDRNYSTDVIAPHAKHARARATRPRARPARARPPPRRARGARARARARGRPILPRGGAVTQIGRAYARNSAFNFPPLAPSCIFAWIRVQAWKRVHLAPR